MWFIIGIPFIHRRTHDYKASTKSWNMLDNCESLELFNRKYFVTLYSVEAICWRSVHTYAGSITHARKQELISSFMIDRQTDTTIYLAYFCLNRIELTTHLLEFINFIEAIERFTGIQYQVTNYKHTNNFITFANWTPLIAWITKTLVKPRSADRKINFPCFTFGFSQVSTSM